MKYADVQLRRSARSAAISQLILVLLVASSFALFSTPSSAAAVLFGGFAVGAGTALHAWKLLHMTRPDGSFDLTAFYQGALIKVLATVALLVIGLGPLRLYPPALLAGVAAAYVALLFARSYAPRRRAGTERPQEGIR